MNDNRNAERAQSKPAQKSPKTARDLEEECLAHMANNGIPFEGPLKKGKNRFSIDQKKHQTDEFSFCRKWDFKGLPYLQCTYGTWSGGYEVYSYKSCGDENSFSPDERIQFKIDEERWQKECAEDLRKEREERRKQALEKWKNAKDETFHDDHKAYLDKKQVKAHGIRFSADYQGNPVLVVPIRDDAQGEIQAIQYIDAEGKKRIHGAKRGNFHILGSLQDGHPICVSEGYATAASVYEATGHSTIVAFDCGNLEAVIANLRTKYPQHQIIIAADDDRETNGNPGKTKAEEAAKKHGCSVCLPSCPDGYKLPNGKPLTDFNDVHVHFGLEEVKKQLQTRRPHLTVINISKFLEQKIAPRELILAPWLPEQGLTMIYAKRGVGKTFVALSIAYAVASGGKVFGETSTWAAPKPRRVLYIDGEMPATAMQERLAKIALAAEKEPPDPSYFKLITSDLQEHGIRDLCTPQGQADINEHLHDVDLIVLDNLSTLVRSGRENDAESWLPVQEWALRLRRKGKAVLFVHHAGKSGLQRGSSRREDILDTVVNLRHPKDYEAKNGAEFEVHFEKARGFDGEAAESFLAKLSEQGKEGGQKCLTWGIQPMVGRDLDRVVELYKDGMTNQREISDETGFSLGKVNKLIKQARADGLIV